MSSDEQNSISYDRALEFLASAFIRMGSFVLSLEENEKIEGQRKILLKPRVSLNMFFF